MPSNMLWPRKWQRHWPLEDGGTEVDRDRIIHTLGNLTLSRPPLRAEAGQSPNLASASVGTLVRSSWWLLIRYLVKQTSSRVWSTYEVVVAAGASAGIGLEALPPVRKAIGSGFETKTITLTCGKLTTGVTVPQWSSILMLRNLKSPETYFQAAFRVQSPWSIKNPNGDDPNEEEILKPVCFVFDFAPTRALRQLSEYGIGLSPNRTRKTLSKTLCRSCPCWPTTART